MSQQYQFQQKTVSSSSSFSDDLNERNDDNLLLINNEAFSPNWMNEELDNKENSAYPLPRIVARMPKLKLSNLDYEQRQHFGKTIFVLLASQKKRWISIFGGIILVAVIFGIWKNPEEKIDLPISSQESQIEPAIVFDSERSNLSKNALAVMPSNAIKSLSDQQNAFPADYSINIENDQNNDVLTALHFDAMNPPKSVYSSNEPSFDSAGFSENSTSIENSSYESSFPNAPYSSENFSQSNFNLPQSESNVPSQYFDNFNSTNNEEIWINDVPFNYSSANQRSNSSPLNNQTNNSFNNQSNIQTNVQMSWTDLQNEPLLDNNGYSSNDSKQSMKNELQRFTPTSRNTQDVRYHLMPNNNSNQYNNNQNNVNMNQGTHSFAPNQNNNFPINSNRMGNQSVQDSSMNESNFFNQPINNNNYSNNVSPNQNYQGQNQTINYSSSNQGFSQYRH
ncbi:MAG: hypothetical protein Q4C95_04145 [Planctomycetia bacterium]|nr:hypothetical protein [Planctomycetia bacterium]